MTLLLPLFAVLLWSLNAIISKLSAGVIEPGAISFYRWLLAVVLMTPFVLPGLIRHRQVLRQHFWRLMVLGLLGMVMYQSLVYYAAQSVSALMIGIINSLIPLLTVLFSLIVLRLTPTLGMLLGAILSFAGLVWLISQGHPLALLTHGIGRGELMMLIASASYALYGVLTRRWAIPLSSWQTLYVQALFGLVMLLPGLLTSHSMAITPAALPMVAFAGVAASLVAPYLWILGLVRLGANKVAIFMNLMPLFTALIAILWLHEQLQAYHLIGGGVTLAGVILSQRLPIALTGRAKGAQKMPS